jgi:hypothetical protein
LKDGKWSYEIKPGTERWPNAEITRLDGQKQTEYWFYDGQHGLEQMIDINGIRTTKKWFPSGLLGGRIFSTTQEHQGKILYSHKIDFDEFGQPIRELRTGAEILANSNRPNLSEINDIRESFLSKAQDGSSIYTCILNKTLETRYTISKDGRITDIEHNFLAPSKNNK